MLVYQRVTANMRIKDNNQLEDAGRDVTAGCIELCIPIAWLTALFCIYSKVSKHSRNVDILWYSHTVIQYCYMGVYYIILYSGMWTLNNRNMFFFRKIMRADVLRTSSRSLIKNHQLQATGCETTLPTWLTPRNPGGHKKLGWQMDVHPTNLSRKFQVPTFLQVPNHHMFGATWSLTRPWPADWQPFTLHLTSRRWQPRGRLAGGAWQKKVGIKDAYPLVN